MTKEKPSALADSDPKTMETVSDVAMADDTMPRTVMDIVDRHRHPHADDIDHEATGGVSASGLVAVNNEQSATRSWMLPVVALLSFAVGLLIGVQLGAVR